MLQRQNFMYLFQMHLSIVNCYNGSLFRYNKNLNQLEGCKRSKCRYITMLITSFCFTAVLAIQMLEADNVSFGMKAQSGFFLVSFSNLWIVNWLVLKAEQEICQLSNRIFQFEARHYKRFGDHWNDAKEMVLKVVRLFDFIGTTTSVVSYIIYICQIWVQPCFPGNFGYMFYAECKSQIFSSGWTTYMNSWVEVAVKIILVWFSSTCALFMFSTFTLVVAQFTCVFSFCYRNYLIYLQNIMGLLKQQKTICDEQRNDLIIYKQIQVLLIHHNCIHQSLIVVVLLNQAMFVVIVGLFLIIGMYTRLEIAQQLLFVVLGFDALLVLVVVFGILGLVYVSSMKTLEIGKEIQILRKDPWARRYIRSWPPLKIGLGSVNFIDKLTGLVSVDFSVNQTVNLLMMDRKN
ncbi:unnamed protein product [Orchesella dallaii]|uniref:Odorant receptor n=1 Tax=Orchesella dallaii TaxID=48710 RepID=A0ABP1PMP3_9HEXA